MYAFVFVFFAQGQSQTVLHCFPSIITSVNKEMVQSLIGVLHRVMDARGKLGEHETSKCLFH